jgi:methyltransferase OMS1, mitochondrial
MASTRATTTTLATKLRYMVYIGASSTVFGSAAYLAYHTQRMDQQFQQRIKEQQQDQQAQQQQDQQQNNKSTSVTGSTSFSFVHNPLRNEQYSKVATCYDDAIGRDEFYMGINLLRRLVLYWYAKGTVLEVGAGTGRNIPFYRYPNVQRIVLVDTCYEMLEQARDKVLSRNTKGKSNTGSKPNQPQYAFVQGDSAKLDQLPDHSFDTVIDTFGLCSYDDPIAVIREMIRKCKRKEDNGMLIFIEHGRSKTWNWITQHLDKHAEQHAANWGCVWNRDLDVILQTVTTTTTTNTTNSNENHKNNSADTSSSLSMEIIHLQTFHFGTTYVIVARPSN